MYSLVSLSMTSASGTMSSPFSGWLTIPAGDNSTNLSTRSCQRVALEHQHISPDAILSELVLDFVTHRILERIRRDDVSTKTVPDQGHLFDPHLFPPFVQRVGEEPLGLRKIKMVEQHFHQLERSWSSQDSGP